MQLALVVAVVALLVAALVIVVVVDTAWRTRTADLAALRVVGLAQADVRRVATTEQVVLVLVGIAIGALAGWLGAALTLPMVPFFTRPLAAFPPVTTVLTGPLVLAVLVTLALLLPVAVAVGVAQAREARPRLIREER
ncbi:FtsX-like permease family protein [Arsenicicoccus piscis]|uniref:ABC3 transporter permease C-terminal domain-containing protein n=1 Tax=Arsenicicoccus piscis TaxID=673954 RepID=A0ABQ6HJT5_9MICO|nr:FtsX-like permease family protein [Arsenicicoccus piscis]MCH8627814.1 FtsX-like permease family protein [Arsenicicoccus piscis]GMA18333.1 hypothetical protein GCM10025862_03540 [Arsenicicoccus piscis]